MKITTTGDITLSGTIKVTITETTTANNKLVKTNRTYDSTIDKTINNESSENIPEEINETNTKTFEVNLNDVKSAINAETSADASGEEVIKHVWSAITNAIGGLKDQVLGKK